MGIKISKKSDIGIMPFCFRKGKVIPKEEAVISMASHSLQYGSTCIAGIRGYVFDNKVRIFRLKDHYKRLINSSKIMGFGFYISYEDFEKAMNDLIQKNRPKENFYIRAFLHSDNEEIKVTYTGLTFSLGIYMLPLNSYYSSEKGLSLMVSSWKKYSDSAFSTKSKSGGTYINSSIATSDAQEKGYDDALMSDNAGNIVEASVSNMFMIHRGKIIIPPASADALEGITMRTVIELLEDFGYQIRYENISRSMIYTCDELFLTGSAAGIIFVNSVDDRAIGDKKEGVITKRIREDFEKIIQMKHPKSEKWVSEFVISEVYDEAYSYI